MFQRIVVPLDGSLRAERAIPVAARLARASGGSVVLLRVVSRATEYWPAMVSQPTMKQTAMNAELTEAETYLSEVATRANLDQVATETVALSGSTASTLLDGAHSCQADLMVLCSHGYTAMTRWVLGSVAEKVARHTDVPVLILREGGPLPAGPHADAARPLR